MKKVIICSPDTDVFVSALYHFGCWKFSNLNEIWIVSGKSGQRVAFPIHDLIEELDSGVIDVLPAVHSLSGCDSTSKIGSKTKAFKTVLEHGNYLLNYFGKSDINDYMIDKAE